MQTITVYNKEELEKARNQKYEYIIIEGDFARKVHNSKKITTLSTGSIALISGLATIGVATAIPTGGVSLAFAAAPIAITTGVSTTAIIATVLIGVSVVIALFKDYDEIEVDLSIPRIKLKKKHKLA